jgi:hypothetical protein
MPAIQELRRSSLIAMTKSQTGLGLTELKPKIPLLPHSSPTERINSHTVARKILTRVKTLIKNASDNGYRVNFMVSPCGQRNAQVVERNSTRNRLVAALITEGENFGAILFGNLDGTPLEVSFGYTDSFGVVPTYRKGENVGNGSWNMFFPTPEDPYLRAVGIE